MSYHKPVLLNEIIDLLNPKSGQTYLDVTAGGGGHAQALALKIGQKKLTLVDADLTAVNSLKTKFKQAQIYHNDFASQVQEFYQQGRFFDLILADLGLSLNQLSDNSRGFSFASTGPLDMRFNNQNGLSLLQLLSQTNAFRLGEILRDYGEEKAAFKIARQIKEKKPQTALELAQLITKVKFSKNSFKRTKTHPATQSFMALRIWTNDELSQLKEFLKIAPLLLNPGGRLAIISFHSLEDRLVKHTFKDLTDGQYDASYFLKNKKPIIPTISTLLNHPQARSAKLRCLQRN